MSKHFDDSYTLINADDEILASRNPNHNNYDSGFYREHKMIHKSLDTETLGTVSNYVIISIGACTFDFKTKQIIDTFKINVDAKSCEAIGLETTRDTIKFWNAQDRDLYASLTTDAVFITEPLISFSNWYTKDSPVWCWHKDFDAEILRNAYRRVWMKEPWDRHSIHCAHDYATLNKLPRIKSTIPHNPLEDAIAQAKTIMQLTPEVYK